MFVKFMFAVAMHYIMEASHNSPYLHSEFDVVTRGNYLLPYHVIYPYPLTVARSCLMLIAEMLWVEDTCVRNHYLVAFEGVVFYVACVAYFGVFLCQYDLGRYFTHSIALHSNHRLITAGLYKYILHPYATCNFIINVCFMLFFGVKIQITILVSIMMFLRMQYIIGAEEHMMYGRFFESYYQGRGRFIPGIRVELGNFLF